MEILHQAYDLTFEQHDGTLVAKQIHILN